MVCDFSYSKHFRVSKADRISTSYCSSGNQLKWKVGDIYIKLDTLGYESIAEYLASRLLQCSSLSRDSYVVYELCDIYEEDVFLGHGCYSRDFRNGAVEVTFVSILESMFVPLSVSYDDVINIMYDVTGLNVSDYVQRTLCLDAIIRNDDRHFGNLAVLKDSNGYRECPIFDNGGGCMSDIITYPITERFYKNYNSIYAKPFKFGFRNQIYGSPMLQIDIDKFFNGVECINKYVIRAVDVIKVGLAELEGIAWEEL